MVAEYSIAVSQVNPVNIVLNAYTYYDRVRTPLSKQNSRSFSVYSMSFITFFQEFLHYLRTFKNSKSSI